MALSVSSAFQPISRSQLKRAATILCKGDRTTYPDIERWDVSLVTNFEGFFEDCKDFNADISSWDTAKMMDMSMMFAGATAFNGDL